MFLRARAVRPGRDRTRSRMDALRQVSATIVSSAPAPSSGLVTQRPDQSGTVASAAKVGTTGIPAAARVWAVRRLLAAMRTAAGRQPSSVLPRRSTSVARCSRAPPVSGAVGQTASAASTPRTNVACGSSSAPTRIVSMPGIAGSRASRLLSNSIPGQVGQILDEAAHHQVRLAEQARRDRACLPSLRR